MQFKKYHPSMDSKFQSHFIKLDFKYTYSFTDRFTRSKTGVKCIKFQVP